MLKDNNTAANSFITMSFMRGGRVPVVAPQHAAILIEDIAVCHDLIAMKRNIPIDYKAPITEYGIEPFTVLLGMDAKRLDSMNLSLIKGNGLSIMIPMLSPLLVCHEESKECIFQRVELQDSKFDMGIYLGQESKDKSSIFKSDAFYAQKKYIQDESTKNLIELFKKNLYSTELKNKILDYNKKNPITGSGLN